MLRCNQTHPHQEIILQFLPIYYFTPFKNTYDNTNTFLSFYDSEKVL